MQQKTGPEKQRGPRKGPIAPRSQTLRDGQRAEHTAELRSREQKVEESSKLWTEIVTRAAEPTAAAGHHQGTPGLCYTSRVAPKETSIKTNVTSAGRKKEKTREVVKV